MSYIDVLAITFATQIVMFLNILQLWIFGASIYSFYRVFRYFSPIVDNKDYIIQHLKEENMFLEEENSSLTKQKEDMITKQLREAEKITDLLISKSTE